MYGLCGKAKAHPGGRDALVEHLLKAAAALQQLDGCYLYVVSRAADDPDGVWVYEVWHSQADHQGSLANEAVKELITAGRPLIASFGEYFEMTPMGGKGL
jgi:quinol monooxygenase YgiN